MELIGNIIKETSKSKDESYLHYLAKYILSEWLRHGYDRFKSIDKVLLEKKLYLYDGKYIIPDITCYNKTGDIIYIFEVVNTNELLGGKINKIQQYKYYKHKSFRVFEVSADWILSQLKKPEDIQYIEII